MASLLSFKLPYIIKEISKKLKKNGAKAVVVGGAVRDYYLNLAVKDYDVEVYGLDSMQELESLLSLYGSVNLVGKSFGVLKFKYERDEYDFSFPRRESKISNGHRGFDIKIDANMSFAQASLRRDFTINALGYDIEDKKFLDAYNGLKDLKNRKLRHINDKTFREDSLRVYRAVQFCARFEFTLANDTFLLCKEMVDNGSIKELARERIFEEFKKLLLKSHKPSIGFKLIKELGILKFFPELEFIEMNALDIMSKFLLEDAKTNLVLMFAILSKDINPELIHIFMYRFTNEEKFIQRVISLVKYYKLPSKFYEQKAEDRDIRLLATKVNIKELIILAEVDFLAKTDKKDYRAGEWLKTKAKNLKVYKKPLDNLLMGRDLIKLGLKPSPRFKKILDEVYCLQIDGIISNYKDALKYIKKYGEIIDE